jgi:hypothetical protein
METVPGIAISQVLREPVVPTTPDCPPPEDSVTESGLEYQIVFKMGCTHQVIEFLKDLESWTRKKREKELNKPFDRRGQTTKMYHEMAREFHNEHPIIPYRECYRIVASNHR